MDKLTVKDEKQLLNVCLHRASIFELLENIKSNLSSEIAELDGVTASVDTIQAEIDKYFTLNSITV